MVAGEDAYGCSDNSGAGSDGEHFVKTVRPKMGDTTGCDQHGDNQDNSHSLECYDDRQREQAKQKVVQKPVRQCHHTRLAGIEANQQKVFSEDKGDEQDQGAETQGLPHLRATDP